MERGKSVLRGNRIFLAPNWGQVLVSRVIVQVVLEGFHFSGNRVNQDLIGSLLQGSDRFDAGELSRLGSRQRHRLRAGSKYGVVIIRELYKATDKLWKFGDGI